MNNNMLTKVIALAALCLLPLAMRGQQAITFAGGDVKGPGGSISFSAGEIATQNVADRAIDVVHITESFNEGVQQPVTSDDDVLKIEEPLAVELKIYPNPTTESVVIECSESSSELTYTLYSPEGRVLMQGKYLEGSTELDLRSYAIGNYMLQVADQNNKQSNLYKIIKLK